jgi:hypothetical protein
MKGLCGKSRNRSLKRVRSRNVFLISVSYTRSRDERAFREER